jgi:isoleucyl-tRNA synthetase
VVRPFGKNAPDSVHLCSFPTADASLVDEGLSKTTAKLRELVSLGLKVRTDNKLRVRQPLSEVEVILSSSEDEAALAPHVEIMAEELNVKGVRFAQRVEEYCDFEVKPNFKLLGKRLGPKMKAVQAALRGADPNTLKASLDENGKVDLELPDGTVTLSDEEILVNLKAKEGFATAGSSVGVVVLNTRLTPELEDEGRYREVLSRIQSSRKDLNLDFDARIDLALSGDEKLVASARERLEDLKREVLAQNVVFDRGIGGEVREFKVDGQPLAVEIVDLS